MPTTHYHKIVRDKVPEVIKRTGATVHARVMPVDDFARMMRMKLVEEAQEVESAKTLDALVNQIGDVLDVIAALQSVLGVTPEAVAEARKKKNEERGGFEQRIFLESVDE